MNKLYLIIFLLFSLLSSAQSSDSVSSQEVTEEASFVSNKDFSTDRDVKIYPNPVENGYVTIKTSNIRFFKSATIYDVLGREVLKVNNINSPIDVSSVKAGVYILYINEIGKTFTRKLVIQ